MKDKSIRERSWAMLGMGHAMETGYRIIDVKLDGAYSCANCLRVNTKTCPKAVKTSDAKMTCNYHKINTEAE